MTDDDQWRRPPGQSGSFGAADRPAGSLPAPPPGYAGPPRGTQPPPDWRPKVLIQAPPPRALPPQDLASIDVHERDARTVTLGVGMVAGAILLIVLFVLCGRTVF